MDTREPRQAIRPAERDASVNSVLGKAFAILRSFQPDDRGLTLRDIADRTGLAKSTVHRLIRELVDHSVIATNDDGHYVLGLRMFELARLVPVATDIREAALPFLTDLYEATHETVQLGVLDETEVVYLERIPGRTGTLSPTRVGGRMPSYCTGLGKAMLAFAPTEIVDRVVTAPMVPLTRYTTTVPDVLRHELTKIEAAGVAFDREEARLGLACVAAPLFGSGNRLVGAMSISCSTSRMRPDVLAPTIRTAALALSRTLRVAGVPGIGQPRNFRHLT